jgi:hypothetical protein
MCRAVLSLRGSQVRHADPRNIPHPVETLHTAGEEEFVGPATSSPFSSIAANPSEDVGAMGRSMISVALRGLQKDCLTRACCNALLVAYQQAKQPQLHRSITLLTIMSEYDLSLCLQPVVAYSVTVCVFHIGQLENIAFLQVWWLDFSRYCLI